MILTPSHINDIILKNPQQNVVQKGVEYNKILRMHLYGADLHKSIQKIEDYETESLYNLRLKYSRSNKDLFSRLGRPIDKVFSARGGSVYYNLAESQDKRARAIATDVRHGFSVRKWVEVFWKAHLLDDPFGIILMEVLPRQEAILAQQQGRSVTYPTYKSITSIYDYLPAGNALEYVAFKLTKEEKAADGIDEEWEVFRLIDDAFDYYVRRVDKDNVIILWPYTKQNYFGKVPGRVNSDLVSAENEQHYLSLFDDVIELANHFFLKGSIKLTHEFMHGYPKYWELADDCTDCDGTKFREGKPCPTCKGSGKRIMLKVSDAKILPYPDKENPTPAPNVAGYVSPDQVYYEISTADLKLLEELMSITLWGASAAPKTQGLQTDKEGQTKTATEIISDIKPQADRLQVISEMAERRHKFILDLVIQLNILPTYKGSSVNYGRRYMIEGPDEIWARYSEARVKGASVSVLDDMLRQYLEVEHAADPVALEIQEKMMLVEPFVHLTAEQVDAAVSVTNEDKAAKRYFGEWKATLNTAMILSFAPELLREQLNQFAAAKAVMIQQAKDKELKDQMALKKPIAA